MAGRYKPYPEYKESGVEWLEDIPKHWDVRRNKAMFSLTRELVGKKSADYQLLSLTLRGVVTRDISDGGGKVPAEFDTYQVVRPKNLIFCLFDIDETPRTIGISNYDGMITGAYNVYRCLDSCVPEYAYYYFMHIDSFKGLKPFYTGLRKVVRSETFSNIKIPVPSKVEQEKIANFLDHETSKIDTLIEKQQQLIQLLKEKRQAVISHAVTKGLSSLNGGSNAKLRDSGVEWLGEVPEHWKVSPLKYVCKLIDGDRSSAYPNEGDLVDEGIPFVSSKNIVDFKFTKKNLNYITREKYEALGRGKLAGGDLVITVRGTIGHVGIFDPKIIGCDTGFINAQMMIMRPKSGLTDYLQCISESFSWLGQLDVAAYGSTIRQLSNEILGNIFIAIPSADEIPEFVEILRNRSNRFKESISKAEAGIGLMQERRTALISAAVTGKIDVRDWVAPQASQANKEVAA